MVAEDVHVEEQAGEGTQESATESPHGKEGLPQLVAALSKVADLQVRIWLTRLKMTSLRIGIYFMLFGVAAVMGFLAIVFLYIGAFRVLTDVVHMRTVWAFVLFGGVHLVAAVVLVMVGTKILTRGDRKKKLKTGKAAEEAGQ